MVGERRGGEGRLCLSSRVFPGSRTALGVAVAVGTGESAGLSGGVAGGVVTVSCREGIFAECSDSSVASCW